MAMYLYETAEDSWHCMVSTRTHRLPMYRRTAALFDQGPR